MQSRSNSNPWIGDLQTHAGLLRALGVAFP